MPTIRVSVVVEIDGAPVANFPFFARAAPTSVQSLADTQASGGGFVAIPSTTMTTVQTALLQSSQQVSVAFNGVTATPIVLTAGGILCVLGGSLTALSVSNVSGQTTTLTGLVAGV